jgi:protocatechuate 3,4-dioxygenase alpha subunit
MPGQTPSQTVGPYFAYGLAGSQYGYPLPSLFGPVLVRADTPGQHIRISGQVLDGEGRPVNDALIEIAHADSTGRRVRESADVISTGFRGFGRMGTGTHPDCLFEFRTVKPAPSLPGEAPFVLVILTMRGLLSHVFTRIYFEDEPANSTDPVLSRVMPDRRHTLVARRIDDASGSAYRFDIRMQGPDETVFFDV